MNPLDFYIDGRWERPFDRPTLAVVDPHDEQPFSQISLGSRDDLDRAVAAAQRAFVDYSQWSREQRLALLAAIIEGYRQRSEELAQAVHREMGAPLSLARSAHVPAGLGHLQRACDVLRDYPFDQPHGSTLISREPIGVCGLITPWNWPLNQLTCKVAPALAAGCTLVLKPSERAPLSAADKAQLIQDVSDDILGYGPIDRLLKDEEVTEVMVNGPDSV